MSGDVIVIGGGAAGIIGAWRAAACGATVTLLEKNDRLGIKILISGGGKCNITHDGTTESLLAAFRRDEARFLAHSCYRFTNQDILQMLTVKGLEVYTRPDGRVFPAHGTARDVVAILRSYLEESGVSIRLQARVTGITAADGRVRSVRVGDGELAAEAVIVATGGRSYPATGTTGDGWAWARELGHSVTKVRAALAPIIMERRPPEDWAGVSLRDCLVKAKQDRREFARWRGDLLFTHRGISGPPVLGISREVAERMERGTVGIEVDLAPDQSFEDLTAWLMDYTKAHPRRAVGAFVDQLVPDRLTAVILRSADVEPSTLFAYLSSKLRSQLIAALKAWSLGQVEQVPIEKGEVTAGGVALEEVDPRSMRSRKVRGLTICGEVLDVAGPLGGYNLQAAFSTGYVAGETAAYDVANSKK